MTIRLGPSGCALPVVPRGTEETDSQTDGGRNRGKEGGGAEARHLHTMGGSQSPLRGQTQEGRGGEDVAAQRLGDKRVESQRRMTGIRGETPMGGETEGNGAGNGLTHRRDRWALGLWPHPYGTACQGEREKGTAWERAE